MKKRIFLLLLFHFAFIFPNIAQNVSNEATELIDKLLANDYKISYSKGDIDKKLIRFLKQKKQINLQLANTGEDINTSDMVIKGFPSDRLILAGDSPKNINFILYENGDSGNSNFSFCLIYQKIKKNTYAVVILWIKQKINSIISLKDAIKNKHFEVQS